MKNYCAFLWGTGLYSPAEMTTGVTIVGNSTNSHISQSVGFYGNGGLSTSNEFYAAHSNNLLRPNASPQNSLNPPLPKRRPSKYSLRQDDFITEDDLHINGANVPNNCNSAPSREGAASSNVNATLSLSNDIKRAIEGVQYIAQHLKNEDEFNSVSFFL